MTKTQVLVLWKHFPLGSQRHGTFEQHVADSSLTLKWEVGQFGSRKNTAQGKLRSQPPPFSLDPRESDGGPVVPLWTTILCIHISYPYRVPVICEHYFPIYFNISDTIQPINPFLSFLHLSFQLLSRIWLFATPWTAAHQASLSITNSWSLLKLMSIVLVMHPTISSPVIPFSSHHQSFPASGSFPLSQFFHHVAKVLESHLQHQSFQWIFRTDLL